MKFDVFKKFKNTETEKSLLEIFEAISTGKFAEEIRAIRDALTEGNEEKASELKKNLFAFAPSARFQDERKMECITDYTGMIVLDFDKMGKPEMLGAMEAVRKAPYTTLAFVSPSGNGIKVLVQVSSAVEHHSAAFLAVSKYYEDITGCKTDPSGKDITRLCFLSYDADAFFNSEAKIFQVERTDQPSNRNTGSSNEEYGSEIYDRLKSFTSQVRTYEPGNRNNYIYQLACNANRWGVVEADLQKWVVNDPGFSDLGSEERYDTIKGVYRNNMKEHGEFAEFANFATSSFRSKPDRPESLQDTPCLPDELFDLLPASFDKILKNYPDKRDRDVAFLTLITCLSIVFPDISLIYHGKRHHLPVYTVIGAPSANGKAVMDATGRVLIPLHERLVKRSKNALEEWAIENTGKGKKGKTPKPPILRLKLPANSSAAMFMKILKDNNGVGIIVETEADTLVITLSQDWGNFSDILRKAFGHEMVSYCRKGEYECIDIEFPLLAMLLSGTMDQLARLFQSAENGLVSRCLVYLFDNGAAWKSAANASDGEDWGAEFEKFGTRLLTMSDWCQGKDIKATICKNFLSITDHIFSLKLKKAYLYSEGAESLPKRYAMITYRLAALLAWWEIMERLQEDGLEPPKQFEIGERHFKIALMITTTLLDHALLFVKGLPNHNKGAFQLRPDMGALWDKFSDLFTRKEGLALAKELGISPDRFNKGLKRWVDSGSLKKNGHGQYEKLKPN